jgi:single-stranded-DNA-specific exonuclease
MEDAKLCFDMFVSDSFLEISQKLGLFKRLNRKRQKIEKEVYAGAIEKAKNINDPVIILWDNKWHHGVLGIVASRLKDELAKPVILFAIDNDIAHGSGRCSEDFDLVSKLNSMQDLFLTYGGHPSAAGITISVEKIKEFAMRMKKVATPTIQEPAKNKLQIDAIVKLEDINPVMVKQLRKLEPYGYANPEPLFVSNNVKIASEPFFLGRDGQDLSFYVKQNHHTLQVIARGMGYLWTQIVPDTTCSIAFIPCLHGFYDSQKVILDLKDIKME